MLTIELTEAGAKAVLAGLRARAEELNRAMRHHIGGYTRERKEELEENVWLQEVLKARLTQTEAEGR